MIEETDRKSIEEIFEDEISNQNPNDFPHCICHHCTHKDKCNRVNKSLRRFVLINSKGQFLRDCWENNPDATMGWKNFEEALVAENKRANMLEKILCSNCARKYDRDEDWCDICSNCNKFRPR